MKNSTELPFKTMGDPNTELEEMAGEMLQNPESEDEKEARLAFKEVGLDFNIGSTLRVTWIKNNKTRTGIVDHFRSTPNAQLGKIFSALILETDKEPYNGLFTINSYEVEHGLIEVEKLR